MTKSISGALAGMHSGEDYHLANDAGKEVRVRYEAEPAMSDDNQPARGYTVGSYHVYGPGDNDYESFRHSPHGPTLTGAKPYAAEQAAKRIFDLFRDRRG